jgi:uncharacterized membrane protein YphA (DoxX/SURF4 family)
VARVAGALLGAVFLVTGVLKSADRQWPATARAFGTPGWLAPVLPWVEIVLGGLLVADLFTPWAAGAAVVLLAGFTVAIAVHLKRGDDVPCGCFGAASKRPVGTRDLVRNLALLGLAFLALH